MLWQADLMDSLVTQHWLAMGEYDKEHKVKLVVDEWGAWHRTTPLGPAYLFSYVPSLRDALVTAITLDIFNRHAEKLAMCNDAQLVNNINTLFLAMEDRFVATTIFHVFDMYKSHQGGRSLRLVCDAPARFRYGSREVALGACRIGLAARENAGDHRGESPRERTARGGSVAARRRGKVRAGYGAHRARHSRAQ